MPGFLALRETCRKIRPALPDVVVEVRFIGAAYRCHRSHVPAHFWIGIDLIMFLKHVTAEQAAILAGAVVGGCRLDGWAIDAQPALLNAVFSRLLDFHEDFRTLPALDLAAVKSALPGYEERREAIDLMLTMEMMCHEIPPTLSASIERWAGELGIDGNDLAIARDVANGELAKASVDFYRTGYNGDFTRALPHMEKLYERYQIKALALTLEEDPALLARFEALEFAPSGSWGRALWEFYTARGFGFPGKVGGVNLAVGMHDWVHVLADYGSTSIGEIEVAAFRLTSSSLPGAVSTFLGLVGMDQGGFFGSALTRRNDDHALQLPGAVDRIADALRRGREMTMDFPQDIDFLDYANEQLDELRATWNIPPKGVDHSPGWNIRTETSAL